ncbi:MAG: DMT family transporter [Candidatus Bipolaricaulota bacterium]
MVDKRGVPLVLGLGVAVISFGAILIRLTDVSSLTVAAWRMVFASAVLVPIALRRSARLAPRGMVLALGAGLLLALHFAAWIESVQLTTVASSTVLVNTHPIFVGVISWTLGERSDRALWQSIALAVGGGLLVSWGALGPGRTALLGNMLALLGGLTASGYLVVGRLMRRHGELLPYVTVAYGTAALVLLVAAVGTAAPAVPQGANWLWVALLALGPQLIGHSSVNWALRRVAAPAVAVAVLGEPAGATLWAYLVFREPVGLVQGVGMLLILGGILRALWRQPRRALGGT